MLSQQMRMVVAHTTIGILGNKLVSTFFTSGDNNWYYADAKGEVVVGEQTINGQHLYFDQTGKQVKGATAWIVDGSISYYDVHTGEKAINRWVKIPSGQWVYFRRSEEKATCPILKSNE